MSELATDRQRREALGVGLAALALLLGLAIVPVALGEGGGGGNPVGPAGTAVHGALSGLFGGFAFLVVVPAVAWALWCFGLAGRSTALRWSILPAGCLLLLPAGVWLAGSAAGVPVPTGGGWIGRAAGGLLLEAFGGAGALVIVAASLLALSVLTLGWSPARGFGGASRLAARVAGRAPDLLEALVRGVGGVARAVGRRTRRPGGSEASPWEGGAEVELPGPVATAEGEGDGEGSTGNEPLPAPARAEAPPAEERDELSRLEPPPLRLLTAPDRRSRGLGSRELERLGDLLIEKLATFRVEGEIEGWTTGPVVTQFEVAPAEGVKVGQIAALADDLALALKAPSVRIVAPIPGKGVVGVEVPNPEPQIVYLREVLESPAYQSSRATLPLALGRDLAGEPYCADLARMPHLLIAGATGSGKSVCINTIITSLIYRYGPRRLRLLLVDPKMVELRSYEGLPHLRHPVVTDNEEAASLLRWAEYEMERRYRLLSANGSRSVREFNRRVREGEPIHPPDDPDGEYADGELPYIVLIVDELADLIMTVQSQVEGPLAKLAQKARAVGIHLVIATQRPSVNVITGLIKANFPSRIAFRVASKTDSRTILDQNGAESLLGNGDMLFLPPGESDPVRIQGAFLSGRDTERVAAWYEAQAERATPEADVVGEERDLLEVVEEMEAEDARVDVVEEVLEDRDELFRQAAEIVITNDSGSTSLLQRRLRIGYGRAARIVDQLHHAGVLGPSRGSQPREVLVGLDELDRVIADSGGEEEARDAG